MSKLKTILILIIVLWIISSITSNFIGNVNQFGFNKIAVIPINGIISSTDSGFFESGTIPNDIIESLKKADKDNSVKGIILEINSPGGTFVASEQIANAVKQTEKPVVALITELGASGAYLVASSADLIIADRASITGSIGVTSSYLEFSGLLEKFGVDYERLVAGKYKDIGSPLKDLNVEERNLFEKKLNKLHGFFIEEISINRNLPEEKVRELATGIFYLGIEAKDLGLVDLLGDKELAINEVKKLANIEEATLIKFEKRKTFLDLLTGVSAHSSYYFGQGFGKSFLNFNNKFEIIA